MKKMLAVLMLSLTIGAIGNAAFAKVWPPPQCYPCDVK